MQVIVIGERNSFIEKKFMVELESKIQAIGYGIAGEVNEAQAAVLVSDGRPLLTGEHNKLKIFLKNKTAVKPHKLLAVYHIADTPVPTEWSESADFVAKELYSIIGCLKDYWFFSQNKQQITNNK